MCGIAGYFSSSKKITEADLRLMSNSISHRGPDADGFYFNDEKTIGLAHRRLSIIDLSTLANQPMYSGNGQFVIVFNGEIYNYREIAAELNVSLKTTSDTEVLVEAFSKWGEGFAKRLNGMFSFAIYDTVEHKMFLYNDRMGIKPIFYYSAGSEFYFASELKAFKNLGKVNFGNLSKTAIHSFLHLGYIPTPHSIYDNIKKFAAGSYAIVDGEKVIFKSYWKLEEQVEKQMITNEEQAKNELTSLLESSVKYRMISDVPFGTFLSGGIDSSLVTAIAQKNSTKPVKSFSIAFEDQKYNEAQYARKVAKHLGTDHHEMMCSYKNALDLFDEIFNVYDEPYSDGSMFPTLLVSKFARQYVTMILSGDGGDETFLGYGAYNWANRLNNPLIKLFRKQIGYTLGSISSSRYKRASHLFNYPVEEKIKSHIFSQEQYLFSEMEILELVRPDVVGESDWEEQFSELHRKLSINEEQALFDLKYYLHDDLLVKVDRASMKYSLEVRVPLLDHRIVKFAINLHPALRKKGGVSKYLLKQILFDFVPREYFDRPKQGFAMPVGKWLKNEWKHLLNEYLDENKINAVGVFNYSVVNRLLHRFFAGEDYLYGRIWLILLFQKWYLEHKY